MAKENDRQPSEPKQSPITQEAFNRRKPVFDPTGRVEHINEDEVKIADVRRHPFGLIILYIGVILGLGAALGVIMFLLPAVVDTLDISRQAANSFIALMIFISLIFGGVFLILATRIYRANQLILTNINVTQVLQSGLFSRKVSELTMENVEDVTADQHGIFATIFNYGDLRIETAGEQNNFIFKYCPNPGAYAKTLQDARAEYLRQHPGAGNV